MTSGAEAAYNAPDAACASGGIASAGRTAVVEDFSNGGELGTPAVDVHRTGCSSASVVPLSRAALMSPIGLTSASIARLRRPNVRSWIVSIRAFSSSSVQWWHVCAFSDGAPVAARAQSVCGFSS